MSSATEKRSVTTFPSNSSNSTSPSNGSNRRFKQPRTVKEFANQVNAVSTMLLNDEISLDKAQAFVAAARVVATTVNTEVVRARLSKEAPDLTLGEDVYEA